MPLIVDVPNLETQKDLPRNSYEEVLNQIYKDLDDAASSLPSTYTDSEKGRATKGAALALKARVSYKISIIVKL